MKTKDLVLHVWHNGDSSVGIDGEQATITLAEVQDPPDPEYLRCARETLQDAFTKLWDFRAHVLIEEELEEM